MSDPIPTKFFDDERQIMSDAARHTGIPQAEVIRRAIRLLKRQRDAFSSYDFLTSLNRPAA